MLVNLAFVDGNPQKSVWTSFLSSSMSLKATAVCLKIREHSESCEMTTAVAGSALTQIKLEVWRSAFKLAFCEDYLFMLSDSQNFVQSPYKKQKEPSVLGNLILGSTHQSINPGASLVRHRTMRQKKRKNTRVRRRNHKGIRLLLASYDLLLIQFCTDPFRFSFPPTLRFLEWGLNHIEQINEVNVMI